MTRIFFPAVLLLASGFAQQRQTPVEITAEPSHHMVLENLFIRAFAVTVNPKDSTLMHRHGHDYLAVALGDSEIQNIKESGQPIAVKFKDGDVRYSPAGVLHAVADPGDQPFHNITIELLQPTTNQRTCTESCAIPVHCAGNEKACAVATKIMTSDQWSVTEITIPAGGSYPQHTHLANFLVVPLTDLNLKARDQDQPAITLTGKPGEVAWNNPMIHTITNPGSTAARFVVLEFRGRPAGEGSESMVPQDQKPGEHKPHDHH
jgi:quercetin dioxygenase-like cupin family protein